MSRYEGLDAAGLERLTGAPLVVLQSSIPSTQDEAHRLGAEGAPGGAVVLADAQTAGRGRLGRTWHSPAGAGVWLSVLLRPSARTEGGALAIRAGLATAEALAAAAPAVAARLRWPNDVMVADRKAGGILCESRRGGGAAGWVAVGIGLNVRGPLDPAVRGRAIGLADVAPEVSRLAVVAALVPRLRALEARPASLTEEERRAFLRSEWRDPGAGDTVDLDPDGALVVRNTDGALDRRVIAS